MEVRRLFPRDREEGDYLESVAIFAARRCRTAKEYDDLWTEVRGYSPTKRDRFLSQVVFEDWAADVLEMQPLIFDLEGIPVWLIIEMLRHRLLWGDFSMEQLSQRAIDPARLKITASTPELQSLVEEHIQHVMTLVKQNNIPFEDYRGMFPQAVEVNLVIGSNLRAFHHFFFMRSSVQKGGKGGAHPLFMDVADEMLEQAQEVYPLTMAKILEA